MVRLPIFPLHTVLFPYANLHIYVFEHRYRDMIGKCIEGDANFGVVLIKSGFEVGGPAVPHRVGTEAKIIDAQKLPDGGYNLVVRGQRRFEITKLDETKEFLQVEAIWIPDPEAHGASFEDLNNKALNLFRSYLRYLSVFQSVEPDDILKSVPPEACCFVIADLISIEPERKQQLLETLSVEEILSREIDILKVFGEKKKLPYVE